MIDELLLLNHQNKIIIRMIVNPEEIIRKVEFGTSSLEKRIHAVNQLAQADYKIGILIAPIVLVDNWKILYEELIKKMREELSEKAKKEIFFEFIFMTYSYIQDVYKRQIYILMEWKLKI